MQLEQFIGEITALAAALSFSLASTTYTLAGRTFGASVSMALSLVISLVFLLPIHQAMHGEIFPFGATGLRWLLLGSSSLAGFVISALLLLRAFQHIGPRLTMLVGSTSPIFAALLALIFLGQGLPAHAVVGIALVLGGVSWVVSEDALRFFQAANNDYRRGLLLALASAAAQGASFVLMSEGVADGFSVMSASMMRTVFALAFLSAYIALRGKLRQNLELISTAPRALTWLLVASLSGPVLGTTLVLVSLQYTSVGISSTLTGTTPILLIPLAYLVFGERITRRAVIGTLVAVAGVAVLFTV